MEFYEKLQQLRKSRGLTQEELAEALYVSRTAVSKWESGRGYPSIDSLKEIAAYFSVTIDELLSGDKLLSIAEKENRENVQQVCDLLLGITDLLSFLLIVLPLYPKRVDGFVYAVSLFSYTEATVLNRAVYGALFLTLILVGAVKLLLTYGKAEKGRKTVTAASVVLGIVTVLFLALAGETYVVVVAFLLLLIKGLLLFKYMEKKRSGL